MCANRIMRATDWPLSAKPSAGSGPSFRGMSWSLLESTRSRNDFTRPWGLGFLTTGGSQRPGGPGNSEARCDRSIKEGKVRHVFPPVFMAPRIDRLLLLFDGEFKAISVV